MAGYTCPKCGKTGNLPDFCCGVPMASSGSYACKTCGALSATKKSCCGQEMTKV